MISRVCHALRIRSIVGMLQASNHASEILSSGVKLMFLFYFAILMMSLAILFAHYHATALSVPPSFVHWSQWKKEEQIGRGAFGHVYLASNRYSMIPSVFRP